MSAQHTPWRVSHSEDDALTFNGERPVAVINSLGFSVACNTSYYPTGLDPDNADLIAAAPDLLEALIGMLDIAEVWETLDQRENIQLEASDTVTAARAAIAKAEGRS